MRFITGLALLLTAVVLGACAASGAAPAGGPPPDLNVSYYRLGAGDRVRIDVFNEPELSLDATLDGTGFINYPLLGRIQASGLTARELESKILLGLAAGYLKKPSVRVGILGFRPIFVVGEVRKAGAYPYVEGLTVEKALALAGGATQLASMRRLFILRETSTSGMRESASLSTPVLPGDTIIVEEGLF